MGGATDDDTLYFYKSAVRVGELERYVITYKFYDGDEIPEDISLDSLWLHIKNIEGISYRAAYLMGPFALYCDVRGSDYHHSQKIISSLDHPRFEPNLQPQQTFESELSLHEIKKEYTWIVDVVSQIIFTRTTQTAFEISVSRPRDTPKSEMIRTPIIDSYSPNLIVTRLNTLDIWNLPAQILPHKKKKHLVVLTHGLHSNVTADLSYLMEQIYKCQKFYPDEQLIVKGYTGNICETEKGVKYLGQNLAKYIVEELYDGSIVKISFIAHSLGGLVQTFALASIAIKYPWFFKRVQPVNFITIASPLLGIVTDNPAYVNLLLSFGVIGKTGVDLNLDTYNGKSEPLLYKLAGEPVKKILIKFKRRTIYANAVNDGIVPLYTSALLFLDYKDILRQLKQLSDFESIEDTDEINSILSADENYHEDGMEKLKKSIVSPITKILSIWTPQSYLFESQSKIPKLSFFESATSIIMPPLPDTNFILNPHSREPVIIHDKVYTENDLPKPGLDMDSNYFQEDNILMRAFAMARAGRGKEEMLEEEIARRWHQGLSWRKVIVALKPDAHNNIIVRRRFANAHGWLVLDHLIEEHFSGNHDLNTESMGLVEANQDLNNMVIAEQPSVEPNQIYSWITKVDSTSVFDEGPTGMISTVGEMFDTFTKGKRKSTKGRKQPTFDNSQQEQIPKDSFEGFCSDFLL